MVAWISRFGHRLRADPAASSSPAACVSRHRDSLPSFQLHKRGVLAATCGTGFRFALGIWTLLYVPLVCAVTCRCPFHPRGTEILALLGHDFGTCSVFGACAWFESGYTLTRKFVELFLNFTHCKSGFKDVTTDYEQVLMSALSQQPVLAAAQFSFFLFKTELTAIYVRSLRMVSFPLFAP